MKAKSSSFRSLLIRNLLAVATCLAVVVTPSRATAEVPVPGIAGCFFYSGWEPAYWMFGWSGYCNQGGIITYFDNNGGYSSNVLN